MFNDWCDSVGLRSLPAEPLTVARYLAVRAGVGSARRAAQVEVPVNQLGKNEMQG